MEFTLAQAVFTIVASILGLVFSSIGLTFILYLHTDKKIDAIAQEMKDFHGRLCAIEERKNMGRENG